MTYLLKCISHEVNEENRRLMSNSESESESESEISLNIPEIAGSPDFRQFSDSGSLSSKQELCQDNYQDNYQDSYTSGSVDSVEQETNSIIINSYRDDPIERLAAPSPSSDNR